MNNNILIKSLFLLFVLAFTACTSSIDIKTDNSPPVIVINGVLTDQLKRQEVRISSSGPYFDEQPNLAISDASVQITSSTGEIYDLIEDSKTAGLYRTAQEWKVEPGTKYDLKVEVDFDKDGVMDTYEASTTVIRPLSIDSLRIVPMKIMGNKNYAVNAFAQDPEGKDYYLFKFAVNDSLISTKITKYGTADDRVFDGGYLNGITLWYFDDVTQWEDDSDEQRKNSDYIKAGDVIQAQTSLISRGYHDFINQCQSEINGENPIFGGPASNITTNISNGGVGYFTGYCITYEEAVVPKYNF